MTGNAVWASHGDVQCGGRGVPRVVQYEGVLAVRAPVLRLRPLKHETWFNEVSIMTVRILKKLPRKIPDKKESMNGHFFLVL